MENVTPRVTTALNDYQKLDSVSKENLWLKLGKEIYRRQVNIFFNFFFFDTLLLIHFKILLMM